MNGIVVRDWSIRIAIVALIAITTESAADDQPSVDSIRKSAERAVSYLSREVATWKAEQKCYSCHNHGDAARAIFAAQKAGFEPTAAAVEVCSDWLTRPNDWDHNGPDGPFSDRQLARIQFAAGLAEGIRSGCIPRNESISVAGTQLSGDQLPSGAWNFEGADEIGAPATYGRPLATVLSRDVLVVARSPKFARQIESADTWLREFQPRSVLDASAVLLGLGTATDQAAERQRVNCRALLARGELPDGGWGPYVTSAPEAFDTALATMALAIQPDDASKQAARRGVKFLLSQQLSDGSWPETTRPTPRESYAQRVSTTSWCVLALLSQLEEKP